MLSVRELANFKFAIMGFKIRRVKEPAFMTEVLETLLSTGQQGEGQDQVGGEMGLDYLHIRDTVPVVGGLKVCQIIK